jgi:hypothetical protein
LLILVPAISAGEIPTETPGGHWWGVVVGVGHYEHLDPSLSLDGPSNDVPLVVTWLRRQGVPRRHLTVLADHVASADGLPTRAAILDALDALAGRMHAGDIAFLYFAGHGSQQPQGGREWSKADGLEEIFLPRDVGRWDGAAGRVEGAIVDHEIGRVVQALRARGIFVWLVFDSCHSATISRSLLVPHVRSRAVAPIQLGIPPVAGSGAPRRDSGAGRLVKLQGSGLTGGYVAFYASQTTESAPELPLPAGEPGRKVHGLFTYAILRALTTAPAGSYRELAHRVLAFYASTFPATTPEFEGSLDSPIGAPAAPLLAPSTWPALHSGQNFRIDSGRLNGVTPQSLLALYAAIPASRDAAPIALLRVRRVTLTDSWADPVDDPVVLRTWRVPADHSAEVAAGVVRLVRSSVDTEVRVAGPATCFVSLPAPYGCDVAGGPPAAAIERARRIVGQTGFLPPGSEFTADVDAADLFLLVRDHRLSVMQARAGSSDQALGVDLDSHAAPDYLQRVLSKAIRSVALTRLAADFPERPGELFTEVRAREATGRWLPLGVSPSGLVPFGAEMSIDLQNVGAGDLDVTVLAIDDRFGIVPVYPVDQESNLLRAGSARIEVSGWARTAGGNKLIFIVERARAGRPHDLGYLAQPGIARHADETGLGALLERIGFSARGSRSGVSEDDQQSAWIKVLRYDVSVGT